MEFDPKFMQRTDTSETEQLKFHKEADRFPMMGNEQFDFLVDDVIENGLQNPIILHEGQILDGRNRYLACLKAGVEPKFAQFEGKDPVAFVYSVNVHRRHLTVEQKLDLVGKLLVESPERSDRAIGQLAQVHHKTVGRVRASLEARGAARHVDSKVDTKGRMYPAHKAKKASSVIVDGAEPSDTEVESWVFVCAGGLRRGDINRSVNELLGVLGAEKKRIAALPESSRSALARRFLELVDVTLEDLRPIVDVPVFEDGFCLAVSPGE